MARNGSGTYTRAVAPYVAGTTITAATVNSEMDDVATALTGSMARDGQSPATANIPMGNFRITGLANAIASTDAAALGQVVAKAGDTMTGALGVVAGTAAAPGLFPSGDTNTGAFFPSADVLALATGGSERLRIDSSGNLGIGTSSPAYRLDAADSNCVIRARSTSGNNSAWIVLEGAGTGGAIVHNPTNTATLFTTNGTERMRIDASGNVGVGNAAANVNDQVGGSRPLLVSRGDSSTTVAGSLASIVVGNADTTTNNSAQLGFAALTGANASYYTSAAISCIFGARTNGQYPVGQLVFSTSTALNQAPTEKMRIDATGVEVGGNLRFDSGYGSAAIAYGVRAWVNFNGTGTVAIRASGGVTSITDNGTGDYTVNLNFTMPDANYCALALGYGTDGSTLRGVHLLGAPTTTSARFLFINGLNTITYDPAFANIAFIR